MKKQEEWNQHQSLITTATESSFVEMPKPTTPVLFLQPFGFYVALRPRRRDDLLGTGTEWEGDRVIGSTAETARKRPERP